VSVRAQATIRRLKACGLLTPLFQKSPISGSSTSACVSKIRGGRAGRVRDRSALACRAAVAELGCTSRPCADSVAKSFCAFERARKAATIQRQPAGVFRTPLIQPSFRSRGRSHLGDAVARGPHWNRKRLSLAACGTSAMCQKRPWRSSLHRRQLRYHSGRPALT
jgi:hypothetical protein